MTCGLASESGSLRLWRTLVSTLIVSDIWSSYDSFDKLGSSQQSCAKCAGKRCPYHDEKWPRNLPCSQKKICKFLRLMFCSTEEWSARPHARLTRKPHQVTRPRRDLDRRTLPQLRETRSKRRAQSRTGLTTAARMLRELPTRT